MQGKGIETQTCPLPKYSNYVPKTAMWLTCPSHTMYFPRFCRKPCKWSHPPIRPGLLLPPLLLPPPTFPPHALLGQMSGISTTFQTAQCQKQHQEASLHIVLLSK